MAEIKKITVQIGSETRSFEVDKKEIMRISDFSKEFENSYFVQYLIYGLEDVLLFAIEGNCGIVVEYFN